MTPKNLIEQKKKDPLTKLNKVFDYKQSKGMPYTHTDTNVYHFQCRPIDMTNWGNLLIYFTRNEDALIAANQTVTLMTEEDVPITMSVTDAISVIQQIQEYYNALYQARWACKEDFKLVTDRVEREGIDVLSVFETKLNSIVNIT